MKEINSLGDICPIPVIKVKKALSEASNIGVLISVDNKISVQNLEKFAKSLGYEFSYEQKDGAHFEVKIVKGQIDSKEEKVKIGSDTAVVISSETMGQGDAELGKTLMNGFIYALTELETLPTVVIFYNGGAKLTSSNGTCIEDLRKLEEMGVEILTCGACMNYYGIEAPEVGGVTNMYSIVNILSLSDKVIKP